MDKPVMKQIMMGSREGFTLIEMTIAIVVLGLALSSLNYAVFTFARLSGNPFIEQQAILIADAYMREIMGASYLNGNNPTVFCPASNDRSAGRASYDNICDYDTTSDSPPQFPPGMNFTGTVLANYTVQVKAYCPAAGGCSQTVNSGFSLGPAGTPVTSGTSTVPNLVRVDVVVTTPTNNTYTLSSYRTYHPNVFTPPLGFSWYQQT